MSYIQFESSRAKDAERQAIRDARERILAEAEERYHKREAQSERARQRGDDKWMLPSVDAKLSEKSKKKKKKEKKSKKKKKRRKSSSDSSSDSSEEKEDEWIEKCPSESSKNPPEPLERDEWMSLSGAFFCAPREKKPKKEEVNKQTCILDKPGQNSRELNPHWKNGGTGLPEEDKKPRIMNPEWLKKSLQRAKEQAEEEGRSLEEIAAERWGSLDAIKSMIEEAEQNCRPSGSSRRQYDVDRHRRHYRDRSRSRSRSRERRRNNFQDWKSPDNKRKPAFKMPVNDAGNGISHSSGRSVSSRKGWRKPEANDGIKLQESPSGSKSHRKEKSSEDEDSSSGEEPPKALENETLMSEDEMNKLGAKIVKAEILGDMELAQELKEKLERARKMRKLTPKSSEPEREREKDVILTVTNSKGMSKPLEPRSRYEEPQGGRRKSKKVETHDKGQRVRYFADDDKYSLQEMFEREKGDSGSRGKDESVFVKMASKSMDMDELFEQNITRGESDAKQDLRDKTRAIKEHNRIEKSLESCRLCFDSKEMLKHLIVAMGHKMYLTLPPHVSLTPGHCIIAPIHHSPCQTQLDEDIYEELKTFKKAITKMCADNQEYPVFFEVAMGLHRFPHMQLECVPMPEEVGSMAPMYFKKALLECEMEWSTNKKVVDLSKKDVKQSIPKGLPYFMVDFGDHGGFAHVIEDEKLFPRNFAQEIIGGMMDLDSSMWRKPRRENFEGQRKKVVEFADKWKKYDFTI
ncbi:CWF19-like protein 2 [Diachasma alloeum]|uniref:CWF19-like protein 2 n=1 Tax=Diachasma alloeum TaxID=454923 RepID=UPI00073845DA|nr:CWF19-like protein 2 [Diachasma alloeum]